MLRKIIVRCVHFLTKSGKVEIRNFTKNQARNEIREVDNYRDKMQQKNVSGKDGRQTKVM